MKIKNFCVAKTCRNGQEALDFLTGPEGSGIDLVIMDVFMPYLNGVETLKKIRENKLHCEVIMVTAANDPATLEETMHLGVIDFLITPLKVLLKLKMICWLCEERIPAGPPLTLASIRFFKINTFLIGFLMVVPCTRLYLICCRSLELAWPLHCF